MNDTNYFSRSWDLLTRDQGWIKPLLVMAAATLVPIAGPLGNKGYALEWARLTAWGVDSAPKQKNVDVGACIASGWRGFVVDLGLGLALGLATSIISLVFSMMPGVLGLLFGMVATLVTFALYAVSGVVIIIAEIRAAIYERIGAGYRLDRIYDMFMRDPKGFGMVFLVNLACSAVVGIIAFLAVLIVGAMLVPFAMVGSAAASSTQAALGVITATIVPLFVMGTIFGLVFSFLANAARMLITTAAALWMRQFDVPSWGKSGDPLPNPAARPYDEAPASPAQAAPTQAAEPSDPMVLPPVTQQIEPVGDIEPQISPEETVESVESFDLEPEPALEPEPSSEVEIEQDFEPEPEPEPTSEPESEPESAFDLDPTPVIELPEQPVEEPSQTMDLEHTQMLEPAQDLEPTQKLGPTAKMGPKAMPEEESTAHVKNVDELYQDLYDVIQRNDYTDDE